MQCIRRRYKLRVAQLRQSVFVCEREKESVHRYWGTNNWEKKINVFSLRCCIPLIVLCFGKMQCMQTHTLIWIKPNTTHNQNPNAHSKKLQNNDLQWFLNGGVYQFLCAFVTQQHFCTLYCFFQNVSLAFQLLFVFNDITLFGFVISLISDFLFWLHSSAQKFAVTST